MAQCKKCGGHVEPDAIGLNLKIIRRDVTDFFCMACLAEYFDTTESKLRATADRYRAQGCILFPGHGNGGRGNAKPVAR